MRDRAVFDSSVIAAIFFKEEASPRSLKIAAEFDPITLDLAVAEVGNVAWKRVSFSGEEKETALDALRDFLEFIATTSTILNSTDLLVEGHNLKIK
jgi:predicted nucleic acid-binding protein